MATLRMFDPSSAQPIKAKHPARPRATFFAAGEISKRCRDALREAAEPVSAYEIGVRAMDDKGLDVSDQAIRSDMARRLIWALHRLESAGQARKVGVGVGRDGHCQELRNWPRSQGRFTGDILSIELAPLASCEAFFDESSAGRR
jgi:hypothetical protein